MARIEVELVGKDSGATAAMQSVSKASAQLGVQAQKTSAVLGGSVAKSSNTAAFALTNLGRVAQDAPFGFIGIQNNLNPLLESFQRLSVESGSSSAALKALGSSLIGPAGLGLALSLVTAGLVLYTQWQQSAASATNNTTQSVEEQRDEFIKTPYEKASKDLQELTRNVSLARGGFLDKAAVLKQYNEGIGRTIGQVTNLDQAEQALVKNGDAYLKLIFLKANAEFAFKKAAEDSYNAAKKQQELDANAPKISDRFDLNKVRDATPVIQDNLIKPLSSFNNEVNKTAGGVDALNKNVKNLSLKNAAQVNGETELKNLSNTAQTATDLATKAQQAVIDFAKKAGFDLNGVFDTTIEGIKRTSTELDYVISGEPFKKLQEEITGAADKLKGKNDEKVVVPIEFKLPDDIANGSAQKQYQEIAANLDSQNKILEASFANTFVNIGESIGNALANGGNVIQAFGQAALGGIADILAQFGKMTIAAGVASLTLSKAIALPFGGFGIPAIAAGVALVAIAGLVRNFSGSVGGSSSSGGTSKPVRGFAGGGTNIYGGLAMVGENGRELVNLPTGSNVIRNDKLGGLLAPSRESDFVLTSVLRGQDLLLSVTRTQKLNSRVG